MFKTRSTHMHMPSLCARTAAFVAAVAVALTNVWIIANYAYPQADAVVVLATAHGH
jgi:hypothetical protein